MADLLKGVVFSQTEISSLRRVEESKLDVLEREGFFQYTAQNPDRQICRFPVQIGPVNIPTSKGWFFRESNDGQCMHKLKQGEFACEKYLDLVDGPQK